MKDSTILMLLAFAAVLFTLGNKPTIFKSENKSTSNAIDIKWQIRFAAENAVKSKLKDPDSAKFENITVYKNVACGTVNAKNSFGGYSGKTRFISAGTINATFFENDMTAEDFVYVWNEKCR